jgi:hypothetical protein
MDLTDRPADAAAPHQLPPQERAGDDLLARALRRARWTILWERLWPALASIATLIGLFLAVSWLGLWLWLPPAGRAIGLGIFFLLTAAAFAPVLMLRMPSRMEGLRRLDRNSGLPHRPATAIADEIAAPTEDSYSVALWRAHIERALRAAKTLKAGTPMPRLALRDPFAVRALVAVLVVATFFAAGGERIKRIAAAFDWQGVMMPANFRIDAWVSPPPYTGRPPVILPGLRPGEPVQSAAALSVPAGSMLVIRATGIHLDVVASGGLAEPSSRRETPHPTPPTPPPDRPHAAPQASPCASTRCLGGHHPDPRRQAVLRRRLALRGEWRTPSSTSMRDSAKRKPRCSGGRRAAPDRWLMRLPYASKMRPVRSADGPRSRQRRATAWAASLACTAANSAASRMGSCSPR